MSRLRVSVTTPFVGKSFCFPEYADTLRTVVRSNPEVDWAWSVLDNSNRASFERRIRDLAAELGIPLFYAKETSESTPDIGLPRMGRVNMIYNRLVFEVMPQDVDYCFVIEDDIAFDDPEAVRKALAIMASDPRCATVTANTLARWHRGRFGKPQTSTYFGRDLRIRELALSGVERVSTSAMGFWFTRMAILKEIGLPFEVNGRHTTDGSWSEACINGGYSIWIDQSIHCNHYYVREDGIMGYVSPTHNAEGHTGVGESERIAARGYTIVKTERKSSPQFTRQAKPNYATK